MPNEDALMPRAGFVNATTNCGDPHAMIGNEGSHQSANASIATNAQVLNLNIEFNTKGASILQPQRIIQKLVEQPVELYGIKANRKFMLLGVVLTVIAGISGLLALGPIGLIAGGVIALGFGSLAFYQGRFNKQEIEKKEVEKILGSPESPPKPTVTNPNPSASVPTFCT